MFYGWKLEHDWKSCVINVNATFFPISNIGLYISFLETGTWEYFLLLRPTSAQSFAV